MDLLPQFFNDIRILDNIEITYINNVIYQFIKNYNNYYNIYLNFNCRKHIR